MNILNSFKCNVDIFHETFVLVTFVHIRNILALYGSNFLGALIFGPKFFVEFHFDSKFIKPFQAEHFRLSLVGVRFGIREKVELNSN